MAELRCDLQSVTMSLTQGQGRARGCHTLQVVESQCDLLSVTVSLSQGGRH